MEPEKRRYLIAYDYGMGGLWGFLDARSEEEIAAVYPELVVVHEPPSWMTQARRAGLREHDIDGVPTGILGVVLDERELIGGTTGEGSGSPDSPGRSPRRWFGLRRGRVMGERSGS